MIALYYILSIVTDALGDAMNKKGRKLCGHIMQATSIGVLLVLPLLVQVNLWYIVAYVLLRFGLFDVVWNLTRKGASICYHGNSSLTDKFWKAFNPPPVFELFGRVVFILMGIGMIIYN